MTYLKMAVALIGAILLVVGVFEPILGVPVFHDQSLMSLRPNVAWTVLGLAALAILIILTRRLAWLYIPGVVALALVGYTPIAMQSQKDSIQSDIKEHVASMPGGLAGKFVGAADLEHGWALMMLGAVLIVAVPLVGPRLQRRVSVQTPVPRGTIPNQESPVEK